MGAIARQKSSTYGLHGHRLITFDGVITARTVTAATGDEREALWELTKGVRGLVMGDKGFLGAFLRADLATVGIDRQTPLRTNMTDPRPPGAIRQLASARRLVETVIGQLAEPFHFEKIRARDVWHLTSHIARKVLAYTLGIFMNRPVGRPDLQFEGLIA